MTRPGRRPRPKLSLLLATLLLAGCAPAAAAAPQGGAARRFTSGELSFDHPAGWEVTREAAAQAQSFILKRAGVDAEIRLIVTPQSLAETGLAPEVLLTAARRSLIAGEIGKIAADAALSGQTATRAPARADFGGSPVEGERLSMSHNNVPVSAEFYALLVGDRLAIVIFTRTDEAAPQAAPAWETFRRTLRSGASPATASNEAAGPAAAAPAPAPAAGPAPSMSALEEAEKLISRFAEVMKQVLKLSGEGNYAAALPLAEQALALAERGVGPGLPPDFFNPLVATASTNLAEISSLLGDYKRAEPLYRRALALREQAEGPAGEGLAVPLNNLAAFYLGQGDHARAEPLFLRALSIFERAYGPEDPKLATALNNISQFYEAKNDYARAEEFARRSLAISEKALGPEHPDVAVTLNNLAAIRETRGDYDAAEQLFRRALAVRLKATGAEHPSYATGLSNLAFHYKSRGDFLRAGPLYEQALAISEKALGPDHPLVATVLDNTAQLLYERGDTERAETLLRRAHLIRERAYGPEHPDVAESLNNLALLLQGRGEYAQAERLFTRALAAVEKAFGPEHRTVATAVDNLASLYSARREFARAEPLFQRALAAREKIFGPASTEVAISLNNIGSLNTARGDYRRAESFHLRSLAVGEKSLGPRHPTVATALNNLSTDYLALDDPARAVRMQQRANDIREHNLSLMLTTGSEGQKRLYMRTLAEETDYSVFLHAVAAPADPQALRLALSAVLQRKGRVLDAMSDQLGALRRRLKPEDLALLDELSTARARLAALVLGGPGKRAAGQYQSEITTLSAEVERLETNIGARRAEVRAQTLPVTLEAVQRAVPQGAALVEIAVFKPYNVKAQTREDRWGAPRYAAYVLGPAGAPAAWADLGDAASLNKSVADLRAALADPRRADARALARALDERVMRPVRALVGDARHVFLSPDGALNLVPFAALVDEQNRYLVETYTITYLTSGRDLLRLQSADAPQQGAVVLANPAFDAGIAGAVGRAAEAQGRRSADLASARFSRLPGTAAEAQAIGAILPGARVLTDAQATEAALKAVARPGILHIATHGFFLVDQQRAAADATRGLTLGAAARGENPLLRSGLALAGANTRGDGAGEDGILTALEAAGLDLWGTKLVVLSACETGVGEVHSGDGVYGLRRALVLAGSESQVMSLWQVSDEATRDLMVEYYRRLQAGEGRSDALRRVQLAMIAGGAREAGGAAQRGLTTPGAGGQSAPGAGDRSHPFYWAAFIQSGEWKGMRPAAR